MTGVGDFIVEEMQRAGIPSVEGVKFTRESKEAIAVPVKQAMISGRVRIPYDRDLIAELNVERYEMSKDGHYVFSHPERSHDDRFWAFCLAAHAALGRGEGGAIIGGVRR
jgi:phage FluMu gp28-like protein